MGRSVVCVDGANDTVLETGTKLGKVVGINVVLSPAL